MRDDSTRRPTLTGSDLAAGHCPERIVPPAPPPRDDALESLPVWGFRDTAFSVLPNGSVVLSGNRYPLCGAEMPDIMPWMEEKIGLRLDPRDLHASSYPPALPAEYGAKYRAANSAAVDEIATNEPPPRRTMARPAYFNNRKTGRTLPSTTPVPFTKRRARSRYRASAVRFASSFERGIADTIRSSRLPLSARSSTSLPLTPPRSSERIAASSARSSMGCLPATSHPQTRTAVR